MSKEALPRILRSHPIPKIADKPFHIFRDAEELKKHPAYGAAKAGNPAAAIRFVSDIVTPENIEEIRERLAPSTVFVAAMSIEASGINRIPPILAGLYAAAVDGSTSYNIDQITKAYHTGANAMERMIARPLFAGEVKAGANHVIVDDVTTLGGTIAEVADHIQRNGGLVVGVAVLADASRTATICASKKHVTIIERRFGDEIRKTFGIEPAALTSSEATYIANFRDVEQIRTRVAKASRERDERLRSKGIQPHQ